MIEGAFVSFESCADVQKDSKNREKSNKSIFPELSKFLIEIRPPRTFVKTGLAENLTDAKFKTKVRRDWKRGSNLSADPILIDSNLQDACFPASTFTNLIN